MTPKQIDQLISILDRAVKVAERWADREYPTANEEEATISRVGDRTLPQSPEEYHRFEPEEDRIQTFKQRLEGRSKS